MSLDLFLRIRGCPSEDPRWDFGWTLSLQPRGEVGVEQGKCTETGLYPSCPVPSLGNTESSGYSNFVGIGSSNCKAMVASRAACSVGTLVRVSTLYLVVASWLPCSHLSTVGQLAPRWAAPSAVWSVAGHCVAEACS